MQLRVASELAWRLILPSSTRRGGTPTQRGKSTVSEFPFSYGHWKAVPVPFAQGEIRPGKSRHYVVSVGFEGPKTARVLTKADPDRVTILFPSPGVQRGYSALAASQNQRIIDDYKIPKENIIRADAADAIKAWAALNKRALSWRQDEEISFLCCGTKPHALALMLEALVSRKPAVLYNLPERHMFVDVEPNGRFWKFTISDLTSISPR